MYNEVISERCMPSIKGNMLRELFQNQLGMFGESNCTICFAECSTTKFRISYIAAKDHAIVEHCCL